jgi:hypothetical protein
MNAPDPFALGGDQRDDAALLTLFREWRAGMRDIDGPRPAEETEDQYDVANGAVWDIARQIYDTPAAGPAGLAIKAFMLAFEVCIDHLPSPEPPGSLGEFSIERHHYGAGDRLYLRNHAIKGPCRGHRSVRPGSCPTGGRDCSVACEAPAAGR